MPKGRKELGELAEAVAASHLRRKGYQILVQNYRCRYGEIDLIAFDGQTLVFVEVRAKATASFGKPEESIGFSKQRKIRAVARHYLVTKWQRGSRCRFDVIAVEFDASREKVTRLEHIENAF